MGILFSKFNLIGKGSISESRKIVGRSSRGLYVVVEEIIFKSWNKDKLISRARTVMYISLSKIYKTPTKAKQKA